MPLMDDPIRDTARQRRRPKKCRACGRWGLRGLCKNEAACSRRVHDIHIAEHLAFKRMIEAERAR